MNIDLQLHIPDGAPFATVAAIGAAVLKTVTELAASGAEHIPPTQLLMPDGTSYGWVWSTDPAPEAVR